MNNFLLVIAIAFWLLLLYYSVLNIAGIVYRSKKKTSNKEVIGLYPSVSVLIPAHNEGKVLSSTLRAMTCLEYLGELIIYVLVDNSTDDTDTIAEEYSMAFPNVKHIKVPNGFPKGKARVLNYGLSISESDYVAVYDADNQPEPSALKQLIDAVTTTPNAIGAVGYVKTINETKNWLTRMIAIEFSTFQLLMQSGRWILLSLGSFTGTNMVVSRRALLECGGWDEYALAEDADLTMKLTARGGLIPVIAESRTWEQEPETFRVWFRQRTRWMQGNLYLIQKAFCEPTWLKGRTLIHTVQLLSVYIGFVFFLMVSDVWFVLGLLGVVHLAYAIPLLLIWYVSLIVYIIQLISASNLDGLINGKNILMISLMYFSYAQMWVILLYWASIKQLRLRKSAPVWDKTVRF